MKEYLNGAVQVMEEYKTSRDGLSNAEAAVRLEHNGKNKLAEGKKESIIHKFLMQLADPMIIILIVAAVILVCALGLSADTVSFAIGSATITLSPLAVASLAGIILNAIFPDKDFKFNSQNAADAVNFEKEVTDKKE